MIGGLVEQGKQGLALGRGEAPETVEQVAFLVARGGGMARHRQGIGPVAEAVLKARDDLRVHAAVAEAGGGGDVVAHAGRKAHHEFLDASLFLLLHNPYCFWGEISTIRIYLRCRDAREGSSVKKATWLTVRVSPVSRVIIQVMNLASADLNLLKYLDVLLREKNVTRAAEQLGITQPAMSNSLKRLRLMFGDPLLIRTSEGMTATDRAQELQPLVRQLIAQAESLFTPEDGFQPSDSRRVFRIMTSDYAEATLVPHIVRRLREEAPNVVLDFLTPSDVSYPDMEQGRVDMALNRFNEIPGSFHQVTLWRDTFSCLLNRDNPIAENFDLDSYLSAQHIWVSKTGFGVGFGMNPEKLGGLGWIDHALQRLGRSRKISIFTRHYQMPALLAMNNDLVATLPSRVARMQLQNDNLVIKAPPFEIPEFELKMAWSPLLHHNTAHRWLRRLIQEETESILAQTPMEGS